MACSKDVCSGDSETNADIDGIGVIIAFIVSAWVTWLFYLIASFSSNEDNTNHLDTLISNDIQKAGNILLRLCPGLKFPISRETIRKIALTLSDQQLITGAAIFIAVYAKTCETSQFDFALAYYLGAAGFVTHQAALKIARHALKEHVFMRAWRLVWVTAILGFLLAGVFIVYSAHFDHYGLEPVGCVIGLPGSYSLLHTERMSSTVATLALSVFLWLWGFVNISQSLWPEAWESIERHLKKVLDTLSKSLSLLLFENLYIWIWRKRTQSAKTGRHVGYYGWWILTIIIFLPFILLYSLHQLFLSSFGDTYRMGMSLLHVTVDIFVARYSKQVDDLVEEEDTWDFGQIMPMLLLALPLFQIIEMLYDDWRERKEGNQTTFTEPDTSKTPLEFNKSQENQFLLTSIGNSDSGPGESSMADPETGDQSSVTINRHTLHERMYESRLFRLWIRFFTLATFVVGYVLLNDLRKIMS